MGVVMKIKISWFDIISFGLIGCFLGVLGFFSAEIIDYFNKNNKSTYEMSAIEPRDRLYGISVPAEKVIWLSGNYGKVVRSEDGGKSWEKQHSKVINTLTDIDAWDRERAVAVGNDGVVIVTADGGDSWQRVEVPRSNIMNKLMRVKTRPNGKAWAVGLMGMVISTEDWGETWKRQIEEEDVAWNGIAFVDDEVVWIVGEFGKIRRSNDCGETWQDIQSPVKKSLMSICFANNKIGVAVGLDGLIIRTVDGGATWQTVDTQTSEHLFEVNWNGEKWACVGARGIIVFGDQSAQKWNVEQLSDYDRFWHASIENVDDRYIVVGLTQGKYRAGIWNSL